MVVYAQVINTRKANPLSGLDPKVDFFNVMVMFFQESRPYDADMLERLFFIRFQRFMGK